MIFTAHLLTGAAMAARTQNHLLGLFFTFLSHYVLDMLPHKEYISFPVNPLKEKLKFSFTKIILITVDITAGVALLYFLSENKLLALTGGLLAALPDADNITGIFPKLLRIKLIKMHFQLHDRLHFLSVKKNPFFWKIFSQIMVIIIAIFFLPR